MIAMMHCKSCQSETLRDEDDVGTTCRYCRRGTLEAGPLAAHVERDRTVHAIMGELPDGTHEKDWRPSALAKLADYSGRHTNGEGYY